MQISEFRFATEDRYDRHLSQVLYLSDSEIQDLISLNRWDASLLSERPDRVVKMDAITRSTLRSRRWPGVLHEEVVQQIRIDRIKQAQEEEGWIANVKKYLTGNVTQMSEEDAKTCNRVASDYEVDENGLLFFCLRSSWPFKERTDTIRLVVPKLLQ